MKKAALIPALVLAASAATAGPPAYKVREIVSPRPFSIVANALNDKGQVVGWFAVGRFIDSVGTPGHAFVYSDGVVTDIFPTDADYSFSEALAINELGQVVGQRRWWSPTAPSQPFLYANGVAQELNPFGVTPLAMAGLAHGINESGQIVGSAPPTDSSWAHAFVLSPGVTPAMDIHPPTDVWSNGSVALAVNDAGRVMGVYYKAGNYANNWDTQDSFLWDGERWSYPDDLLPPNVTFIAGAINREGRAAGYVSNTPRSRALTYDGATMTELVELDGATASRANGINDRGDVVGSVTLEDGTEHAVVWQDGIPYDLNLRLEQPLGLVLREAPAVNDVGQILARAVEGSDLYSTRIRSFLLTPVTPAGIVGDLIGSVGGLVDDGTLNRGQGNSLLVKLRHALSAIQAGEAAQAVTKLQAFIHEVTGFKNAGILAVGQADDLIAMAQAAIDSISG